MTMEDMNVQRADQPLPAPTKGLPGRKRSKVPDPGTQNEAAKRLEAVMVTREESRYEEEIIAKGTDWYVKCHLCNGVAVFLKEWPRGGRVEPDNWYATYRGSDVPYITSHIMCQECNRDIGAAFPKGARDFWTVPLRYYVSPTDQNRRQKIADRQKREYDMMKQAKLQIMDGEAPTDG